MGFGNGAFQAARIAIDGVTIIENIITGKIEAPGTTTPSATSSYLAIPITNNQNVATPAPFQQMIQLNLSQYPQLEGIASDLSNIYFSSDEAGQNKLYSWRETPASLTSDVTWWVLLPDGIPANGTVIIYLQVSSSTALDGVYTGEAPQLSSTYGQYDNGARVFPVYYNFAGSTLDGRISPISGVTLTQNNGLSVIVNKVEAAFYILTSSSATSPFVMEAYETYYGVSVDINPGEQWGFVIDSNTSTSQNAGGLPGGTNFMVRILSNGPSPQLVEGGTILAAGNTYFVSQYTAIDGFTQTPSGITATFDGISISASTTALTSGYIGFYVYSAVANSTIATVNWLRIRAYPPNGAMPVLQAQTVHAVEAVLTATQNTWTMPQTFSAGLVDVNPTYAYVANEGSNNVSVINTSTNTVVATISAGSAPTIVAITPNGLYAYVTNQLSNNVSVINTSTNTVVSTISVGTGPIGVAITPNGLYAYVTNEGSANVSVINTSTNTVVTTISAGTYPYAIAITPNGLYAYVANIGSANVSVIDTSTNTVVATISVGTSPNGVAITPNGLYAYVTNFGSNTVSVINTSTDTVVATISVGTGPFGVAITPNGLYAYVANASSNNVSVINTSTNTVVATITVGTSPNSVAITPNGLYAYVTNEGSANVSVINTSTNTVVTTISAGTYPFGVAVTPYFYTATQIAPYLSGFQQNTSTPQTTLAGSTAGSITYSMPTAEGTYKKFVAYASGYENDTTTAQTISFPVAFVNTPYVATAPSGLISSTTTTGITLASGTTTTYTGWIIIEGY